MPAQLLATTAIVLDRFEGNEKFTRLKAICPEHGIITCMQRIARRSAAKMPPLDLFDEAQLNLESSNQGKTWFVKDALLQAKRSGLGARYTSLEQACRFARVLVDNPVHEESRAEVFALLKRALDAWEGEGRAEAIYFKSLYLFAQDEGYPVREDWRPKLGAEDNAIVRDVLSQPAAEQTRSPAEQIRVTRALEEYLRHESALHIGLP